MQQQRTPSLTPAFALPSSFVSPTRTRAMTSDRDLFLAYGALMSGAVLPIYHGAYASLRTPLATRKALKKSRKAGADEENDEDESLQLPETLTAEDAYWLPVIGSVVLFSMFLVFKYCSKVIVDRLLGFYFGFVGTFAVTKVAVLIAQNTGLMSFFTTSRYTVTRATPSNKDKSVKAETTTLLALRISPLHVPLALGSFALVMLYLATRHWLACNVIALSLSLSSISMLSLDSFQTGGIMLMGLFLYDIFWVFGTNVMVSVARGFEGPIKIVWPKNLVAGLFDSKTKWQMTMLGLGDIVIPGIFVALALRFDQHLYIKQNPKSLITKRDITFAKPYFQATMTGYIAGLATTMGVMHFTKAAQPALLYLSPACIISVALTAWRRGELQEAWSWKDEEADEDKKDGKSGKPGAGKKASGNGAAADDDKEWEGIDGEDDDNSTGVAASVKKSSSRRRRKVSSSAAE